MTRSQRKWHVWIWMLLAPIAVVGAIAGANARRAAPRDTGGVIPTDPAPEVTPAGPPDPVVERPRR